MDLDVVKQAIYTWMTRESGVQVIRAEQSEQRPPKPYGSYKFVNPSTRLGSIDELRVKGSTFTMVGQRRALVSLNLYGTGACDRMSRLRDTLDLPPIVDEFAAANIAVIADSEVRDLTTNLETKYEERAQMDLTVAYAADNDARVVPVEEVEITAENTGSTARITS